MHFNRKSTSAEKKPEDQNESDPQHKNLTQSKLRVVKPLHKKEKEKFTNAVAYFIAACMMPYSIVDAEPFRFLLHTLNPAFDCPRRNAFSDNYIPKLYTKTKEVLEAIVRAASHLYFTSDLWTSRAKRAFLSLTGHFINDAWELVSVTLSCFGIDEEHTGKTKVSILPWGVASGRRRGWGGAAGSASTGTCGGRGGHELGGKVGFSGAQQGNYFFEFFLILFFSYCRYERS